MGRGIFFFENWQEYSFWIPCGLKILTKSLYLAWFGRQTYLCFLLCFFTQEVKAITINNNTKQATDRVCDLRGRPVARGQQIYGRVGKFVSTQTWSPASFLVASGNSQNNHSPKKFIYYQKRQREHFLIEIDEKDTKVSLFYLMHPAYSKYRENRVFSQDL